MGVHLDSYVWSVVLSKVTLDIQVFFKGSLRSSDLPEKVWLGTSSGNITSCWRFKGFPRDEPCNAFPDLSFSLSLLKLDSLMPCLRILWWFSASPDILHLQPFGYSHRTLTWVPPRTVNFTSKARDQFLGSGKEVYTGAGVWFWSWLSGTIRSWFVGIP